MLFVYNRVSEPMTTLHSSPSRKYGMLWIDLVFIINIRCGHSGGLRKNPHSNQVPGLYLQVQSSICIDPLLGVPSSLTSI
jgi:hypothetical protein